MLSWTGHVLASSVGGCEAARQVAYFACSAANPLCTWIEEERPGKSVESKLVRKKSMSVRSARLEGVRQSGVRVGLISSLTCSWGSFPGGRRRQSSRWGPTQRTLQRAQCYPRL